MKDNLPLITGLRCNRLWTRAIEKPTAPKKAGVKILETVGRVSQFNSLVNNSKSEAVDEFWAILIHCDSSIFIISLPGKAQQTTIKDFTALPDFNIFVEIIGWNDFASYWW